jgi:hypothetical protein
MMFQLGLYGLNWEYYKKIPYRDFFLIINYANDSIKI